jgi:pilus assembly protein CpaF
VTDTVDPAAFGQPYIVDDDLAARLERTVREQAKAMREGGQAPESLDLEPLSRDALRELLGLGPIGPLLADDDVSEIQVLRPEYVLVWRGGDPVLADAPFTSSDALARVVRRLANQSGEPLRDGEAWVERTLLQGAHLVAVGPPLAKGWALSIRKRRRVEASIEGLVRAGALSRSVASFLDACIVGHANILVVGPGPGPVGTMMAALASAFPASDRVVSVQAAEDIVIDQAQVVPLTLADLGPRGEQAVRAASRLGGDRLIVGSLGGLVTAATVEAIGQGADGVVAGATGPSARRVLGRLSSQIALSRPGTSMDVAREVVAECFDVAIEVSMADGKLRIHRLAELDAGNEKGSLVRDIFVHQADGAGEAAFAATGTIPKFKDELASRGVRLEATLFKKK